MDNYHLNVLPSQYVPLPVNPEVQLHVYKPRVYLHIALISHKPLLMEQSSIVLDIESVSASNKITKMKKINDFYMIIILIR